MTSRPTTANNSQRRRILLLGQKSAIFNGKVIDNVRFEQAAPPAEVAAACRLACLDGVTAELPLGCDAILSHQGTSLSGGQRQWITLARARSCKSDVPPLHESISALDRDTRTSVLDQSAQ